MAEVFLKKIKAFVPGRVECGLRFVRMYLLGDGIERKGEVRVNVVRWQIFDKFMGFCCFVWSKVVEK